jgi:hypothetical protein
MTRFLALTIIWAASPWLTRFFGQNIGLPPLVPQAAGGKRFELSSMEYQRANAAFFESHAADQ